MIISGVGKAGFSAENPFGSSDSIALGTSPIPAGAVHVIDGAAIGAGIRELSEHLGAALREIREGLESSTVHFMPKLLEVFSGKSGEGIHQLVHQDSDQRQAPEALIY
jgi:hypothetical protein